MDKNRKNPHKPFMVVNAVLAFGVLAVVFIFLYISFRYQRGADHSDALSGTYRIVLSTDFAGDSLAVYLNDSLLLSRTMPDDEVELEVDRFAKEQVLMIVDGETDLATPFTLSEDGSKVQVTRKGGIIYILETETDGD